MLIKRRDGQAAKQRLASLYQDLSPGGGLDRRGFLRQAGLGGAGLAALGTAGGFAAGGPRLMAALARVKSYLDYGAFTPIQVAATAALNGPQDSVAEMRALYRERRDLLVRGLRAAGWEVPSPEGSMFVWAPIPERFAHLGSVEFSKLLLARAKVAVAPGLGFGEHGDGHVRIALVENSQRIRQALRGIRSFLQGDNAGPVAADGPAPVELARA